MKITLHQSAAIHWRPSITWPVGVCIHELRARIQKAESVVPTATASAETRCTPGLTRFMPKSMIPRNVASRKKAVKISYDSRGPAMAPTWFMYPGQLVPNWNDMVMPVTTPIANVSAKTFTQRLYVVSHASSPVRRYFQRNATRNHASAIVSVGKRMWNPMFSPNWVRARSRASSMENEA